MSPENSFEINCYIYSPMMPSPSMDVTTGPPKALPGPQHVMPVVTMVVLVVMFSLAVGWSGCAKAAAGPVKKLDILTV